MSFYRRIVITFLALVIVALLAFGGFGLFLMFFVIMGVNEMVATIVLFIIGIFLMPFFIKWAWDTGVMFG